MVGCVPARTFARSRAQEHRTDSQPPGRERPGPAALRKPSPWSADVLLEALTKTRNIPAGYRGHRREALSQGGPPPPAGVQRQYCGALGKKADCQLAASLHRANEAAGTSQLLGWWLYLPENWTKDLTRRQRAGIATQVLHQSKLDLAQGLIDQALG